MILAPIYLALLVSLGISNIDERNGLILDWDSALNFFELGK